ncbi:MAG: MFS transporter, partial [Bacillales bacterium]
MEQDRIWTKDFVLLLASNFFVALNFYLLMTTMAVYAIQQFRASESNAGLAASIFIIGALLARVLAGKFIDVVGRKKLLFGGLILFLLGSVFYLFALNLGFLMAVRFLYGIGFGISTTVLTTVNMSALPPHKRGEGIGYFSLSTAAATAIGPFLSLYLIHHFTFHTMFVFCIIFSVTALAAAAFVTITELDLSVEQKEKIKRSFRFKDFFEKKALPISVLMFISGIGYSGVVSFINPYAMEMNLTNAASFFFIVYSVFLFLGRPVAGKIFDVKGENIVVYPSYLFFSLSLLLIALAKNGVLLLLAGAFMALGYGTLMSSMQSIIGKVSPPHRLGLAISTFFIFMDAGMGTGPYILGFIA